MKEKKYLASGGVILNKGKILILNRPKHNEIRLPKGHIDPGESAKEAALREVQEESGYSDLEIICSLGTQLVEFEAFNANFSRTEHFYLMKLSKSSQQGIPEDQFEPQWVEMNEAIKLLTYEPEKEWVRKTIKILNKKDG